MGMYTGLRFKGILKEEFVPIIKTMMDEHLEWSDLHERYPQYDFLKEFGEYDRADFVPYGGLSYMPNCWERQLENSSIEVATDGFDRKLDEETKLWSFQCSLKNYGLTIEKFIELVVPNILDESVHIEKFYEEWERSMFYEYNNGTLTFLEGQGIDYMDDY